MEPKFPDGDRQFEATRAGAAGIDKENAISRDDAGLMRMTAHDRLKPVSRRIDFQLIDVVNNVNLDPVDVKIQNVGNFFCPGIPVVIAANGDHRGDRHESRKNFGFANIAGVNDQFAVLQRSQGFRPHQSVSVGNQSDPSRLQG